MITKTSQKCNNLSRVIFYLFIFRVPIYYILELGLQGVQISLININ